MTTLTTLRQRVCEELNSWRLVTTTSAGSTDNTTAVSTQLVRYGYDDDALRDKYIRIASTTDTGIIYTVRKIQSYESLTGTAHAYVAFDDRIPTAASIEIHDFEPAHIDACINRAIRDAFPYLCKPLFDSTLIGGNVLPNSSFEDWAATTAPDNWTYSVSACTKDTGKAIYSPSTMKIVGAGYAYVTSDTWKPLLDLEDSTINLYGWVWADTATSGRLQVTTITQAAASVTSSSDYHTGADEWEYIELENVSVPDDLAEIQIKCAVTGANTVYFDNLYLSGTIEDYLLPTTFTKILQVNECNDWKLLKVADRSPIDFKELNKAGTKYIQLYSVSSGKKIELVGYGEYSRLTADTDTISLTPIWERIIVYGTVADIMQSSAASISNMSQSQITSLGGKYQGMYETLKKQNAIIVAPLRVPSFGTL